MRFACSASVMYGGTLPSPCIAKPHFCVQPRKPRQRGGRRAEDLDKTRYLGLSWLSEISRFFYITWWCFLRSLLRLRRVFCLGGIPRSYEYMKIRVRLMRTEEDVNENEEHFVHVGARVASLPRGGVVGAFILSVLCVGRAVLRSCAGVYVYCFAFVLW